MVAQIAICPDIRVTVYQTVNYTWGGVFIGTNAPGETMELTPKTQNKVLRAKLDALSPEKLEVRQGCAVILAKESRKAFSGSTVDEECTSSLRGATFATSEVTVTKDRIESWDRGFDAEGESQIL